MNLTPTEHKIVNLICTQAATNKEIADQIGCSERTVQTHIRNILTKTKLNNRTEIAVYLRQS